MSILEYVKKKCKELKAKNVTTVKFESGFFYISLVFLHLTGIFTNSTVAM